MSRGGGGSRRQRRRQAVRQLLERRDLTGLQALAAQTPQAASHLVGLLNEPEDLLRWRAIEALGLLAARRATEDPDAVRDLIRRQLWSMNDESGNVAWHAAEAVGEILARVPALAPEYTAMLASHADVPLFRAGVLWALDRIAGVRPDLVQDHVPLLLQSLADPQPEARGYAASALGRLGTTEPLSRLRADDAPIDLYDFEQGEMVRTTVAALARKFC
jgi:HEAT repeat protein